jgi:hypothetical protein
MYLKIIDVSVVFYCRYRKLLFRTIKLFLESQNHTNYNIYNICSSTPSHARWKVVVTRQGKINNPPPPPNMEGLIIAKPYQL